MANIDFEKFKIVDAHTTFASPYSLKKDPETEIVTDVAGSGQGNGGLFTHCPEANYVRIYTDKQIWVRFVQKWLNERELSANQWTAYFPVEPGASTKDALRVSVARCLDIEVLNPTTNTTIEVFVSRT